MLRRLLRRLSLTRAPEKRQDSPTHDDSSNLARTLARDVSDTPRRPTVNLHVDVGPAIKKLEEQAEALRLFKQRAIDAGWRPIDEMDGNDVLQPNPWRLMSSPDTADYVGSPPWPPIPVSLDPPEGGTLASIPESAVPPGPSQGDLNRSRGFAPPSFTLEEALRGYSSAGTSATKQYWTDILRDQHHLELRFVSTNIDRIDSEK